MITISINDENLDNFQAAKLKRSVDTVSGAFSFKTTENISGEYPVKVGQSCKIFVNEIQQIGGFIEDFSVSYSTNSHSIDFAGRDLAADLIDSKVGPNFEIKGPIQLIEICRKIVEKMEIPLNFSQDIDLEPFTQKELFAADIDVSGFEFLEKYARMRQAFLSSNGTGGISITRTSNERGFTPIQNIMGARKNNIISAQSAYSTRERFSSYEVQSQQNPVTFDFDPGSETIANQSGASFDTAIRSSRKWFAQAEETSDSTTSKRRSEWEANIRRAKSRQYSCIVQGFSQENGELWQPNKIHTIVDEFARIQSEMLLWEVEFDYSVNSGSVTRLKFVEPDALTLQVEEPTRQKKSNEIGDDFVDFGDGE